MLVAKRAKLEMAESELSDGIACWCVSRLCKGKIISRTTRWRHLTSDSELIDDSPGAAANASAAVSGTVGGAAAGGGAAAANLAGGNAEADDQVHYSPPASPSNEHSQEVDENAVGAGDSDGEIEHGEGGDIAPDENYDNEEEGDDDEEAAIAEEEALLLLAKDSEQCE